MINTKYTQIPEQTYTHIHGTHTHITLIICGGRGRETNARASAVIIAA